MQQFIEFANQLVDSSAGVIRKYFRNLDKIETKSDASPVTIADREAESVLRNIIKSQYPEHGIHGEEFGIENPDAEYQWIIDPIDGTISFMSGRPTFGTMIGLLQNGTPILGIIDQPINHERWIAAKGEGLIFNGKKASVRKCKNLKSATISTTAPEYYNSHGLAKLHKLRDESAHILYGGDCYLYALVACGQLDIALDSGLKPHDFLPIIPIIKEAGGQITDWQGNELDKNSKGDVIVSGDERVHQEAISIIK